MSMQNNYLKEILVFVRFGSFTIDPKMCVTTFWLKRAPYLEIWAIFTSYTKTCLMLIKIHKCSSFTLISCVRLSMLERLI